MRSRLLQKASLHNDFKSLLNNDKWQYLLNTGAAILFSYIFVLPHYKIAQSKCFRALETLLSAIHSHY